MDHLSLPPKLRDRVHQVYKCVTTAPEPKNPTGIGFGTSNALAFLFKKVPKQPFADSGGAVGAKRPPRLPVVLEHGEAVAIIAALKSCLY
jgi:hypothetical protein